MQKIKLGVSKTTAFPITTLGDSTKVPVYDAGIKLPGVQTIELTKENEEFDVKGDNKVLLNPKIPTKYTGTITFAQKPPIDFFTKVLGFKKDTSGALVEDFNATPTPVGLAIEVKYSGGQTGRVQYYKVDFARTSESFDGTNEGSTPYTFDLAILPRLKDGLTFYSLDNPGSTGQAVAKTQYGKMLTEIVEQTTSSK